MANAIEEKRAAIRRIEAEIAAIEREENELEALGPAYKLAVLLHSQFCNWNHTDGCGWLYEIKGGKHQWDRGSTHARWLEKAHKVGFKCQEVGIDPETVIEVMKLIEV